ncbi:MAG: hypothetical protein B6I36_07930 [Desulfobacteraceae bacterium 4572_35.1]|nr:MAG: hypothetical protein B6I36_07930 [Desulfobacteraceae bacterium 4572_35.1]
MVGGFNHNFCYKEQTFHVQTEDSGVKKSEITTLLYSGGTILARVTTSYADILKHKNMEGEVETRMKEQHKQMMRDLKNGCLDDRLATSSPAMPEKKPEKRKLVSKKTDLEDLIVAYLSAGR